MAIAERTILIAEDNRDNREGYAEYFALLGYDVVEAEDGGEALAAAPRVVPDVMLLDLQMPIVDGWEVTRRLKSDPRTSHIPIIAVSACVFPDDERRAADAGADRFLPKPCLPSTVAEAVDAVLAKAMGTV